MSRSKGLPGGHRSARLHRPATAGPAQLTADAGDGGEMSQVQVRRTWQVRRTLSARAVG